MNDLAVLITVYNDRAGLLTALDSINERDNAFTVVLVDGASEEPVRIDEDDYPFKLVVIRQEERSGIIGGLNAGLDYIRAQGFRFMARLDAGDVQFPNRLATQYERLRSSDELAMVGSNVLFRSEETNEELFVTNLPLKSEMIRRWSMFRTCFMHPAVMIHLDRVDSDLRYETKYLHIEDHILFAKIAQRYPTENLREPLLACYVREHGISRSNDREQLISGIRHHLDHPRPLNLLWYAYIVKRSLYLFTPFSWRCRIKNALGFSRPPNHSSLGTVSR